MARWRNKAIVNLLKNSTEKNDHTIAAQEWEFTGEVIDHCVSNQTCQLCAGENLRYHFEIINKSLNNKTLFVGSSCIKKFDIAVFNESGEEIFGTKKSSFLQKKIAAKKQELMLAQIRSLWRKSSSKEKGKIEDYVEDFDRNKAFCPDDLLTIFFLMKKHNIEFAPVLFKVSLRSQFDLRFLINMTEHDQESIFPCLSVAQKKRFTEKKKQLEKEKKEKENREKINSTFHEFHFSHDKTTSSSINFDNNPHIYNQQNHTPLQKPEKKKNKSFQLPECVTCSICGEYTKDWVSFNPNKCRKCLEKLHNNNQ